MLGHLAQLAEGVLQKLARHGLQASGLTVKVKYDNFELVTRARTLGRPFHDAQDVIPHLDELLARTEAGTRKVRLLGVSFSALGRTQTPLAGQLDLFMPD